MFPSYFFHGSTLLCALLLLGGCDAGGGGGGSIAGIDGSGSPAAENVTTGTVDGFGSVIVSGVRYDTSNADITVSGDAATEDNLAIGVYVTVLGSINADGISATASAIYFQPNVIGPISSINLGGDRFVVLGQTIRINDETSFDEAIVGGDLAGLSIAQRVRISGPSNSSGDVIASRVDLDTGSNFEVLGAVSNLDSANFTFDLGSIGVEYSQASLDDLAFGDLVNGREVIVTGTEFSGGILVAGEIEAEEDFFDLTDESSELEIAGLITAFSSVNSFSIGHQAISTNSATLVFGGSLQNLALDAYIEVSGSLNASEILQAEEIEILEFADHIVEGSIIDIEILSEGEIPTGRLSVQGFFVTTTVETRYEDESDMDLERFNFSDISLGDFIAVVGEQGNDGFIASGIERLDSEVSDNIQLQGELAVEGEVYSLFAYVLEFNSGTDYSSGGEEITEEMFFANAAGAFVEVVGVLEGDSFVVLVIDILVEEESDD